MLQKCQQFFLDFFKLIRFICESSQMCHFFGVEVYYRSSNLPRSKSIESFNSLSSKASGSTSLWNWRHFYQSHKQSSIIGTPAIAGMAWNCSKYSKVFVPSNRKCLQMVPGAMAAFHETGLCWFFVAVCALLPFVGTRWDQRWLMLSHETLLSIWFCPNIFEITVCVFKHSSLLGPITHRWKFQQTINKLQTVVASFISTWKHKPTNPNAVT